MSDDYVLEVALELEKFPKDLVITEAYIHHAIINGLKKLFGEVGASFPITLEKFETTKYGAVAIIRCPSVCYIKVRSSITLLKDYNSVPCAFHITRIGTNLLELYHCDPLLVL